MATPMATVQKATEAMIKTMPRMEEDLGSVGAAQKRRMDISISPRKQKTKSAMATMKAESD